MSWGQSHPRFMKSRDELPTKLKEYIGTELEPKGIKLRRLLGPLHSCSEWSGRTKLEDDHRSQPMYAA